METPRFILEIINTIAIVAGATIAIVGVNAWKKQLKGSTEYELARRYLKAVYKIRDAIKYVRNPFISIEEIATANKENGIDNPDYPNTQKTNRVVYSFRWKKVMDARTDLDVELLEAEVIWGKEAVVIIDDFNLKINQLYVSLKMFLEEQSILSNLDIIYDIGENDIFSSELHVAIEKIESFIKPHLK